MYLLVLLGAHGAAIAASISTLAPKPPPPFSHDTGVKSASIGIVVADAFKRCGDAFSISNAKAVEAMGTPKFSDQWKLATEKQNDMLTICHELTRALRDQKDFFANVVAHGNKRDGIIALTSLKAAVQQLNFYENREAKESLRYQRLVFTGWGETHCAEKADGYMEDWKLCSSGNKGKPPLP